MFLSFYPAPLIDNCAFYHFTPWRLSFLVVGYSTQKKLKFFTLGDL
ncbi:hypothetical protein PTD2_17515 [Pseudoalteromonas tunicata D2]|uniref:Uncharacterized protein n=1 Tax=Pseudoalteromonas tunicata D2 TaxID=87626 RepID=A4CBA6_9GAMM|nr:hypothetical protein PTD2_17515 [Pseudoalteromonas tunicata D2]